MEIAVRVLPSFLKPKRQRSGDRVFSGGMTVRRGQHGRSQSNTSSNATSAIDTLIDRVGVCRDFAHLMIALCCAANLPARIASGIDYGADPALGPPDFHAYMEVFLSDRWYIFNLSSPAIPTGFVRFATGYDAADIAFVTIFGNVSSAQPFITDRAVPNAQG